MSHHCTLPVARIAVPCIHQAPCLFAASDGGSDVFAFAGNLMSMYLLCKLIVCNAVETDTAFEPARDCSISGTALLFILILFPKDSTFNPRGAVNVAVSVAEYGVQSGLATRKELSIQLHAHFEHAVDEDYSALKTGIASNLPKTDWPGNKCI